MFSFIPIASSSKGNCTIIETAKVKVLIDIGISYKNLINSLNELNIMISDISGLFITHIHSDHIKGLKVFLANTDVEVYMHADNIKNLIYKDNEYQKYMPRLKELEKLIKISDLHINYYELPHRGWMINNRDSAGKHVGFLFKHIEFDKKLCYATDLGHLPESIVETIKECDAYFFEANYDHEMQINSDRPLGLIKRNLGNFGHLSNQQSAEYLAKMVCKLRTSKIVLAHLSEQCNTPELAQDTVMQALNKQGINNILVDTAKANRYII